VKLKAILSTHTRYASVQSLSGNLGDGYLLTHNSIYRNIRTAAKAAHFKFSSKRFRDYDSLALTQLPQILSEKIIPYCDNVNALKEIEQKAPGTFDLKDLPPLRSNHVFHESAHAAGHGLILSLLDQPGPKKGIRYERTLALHTLLEEAFANACESLANLDATSEIHDEFLYKNAYVMETPATRKLLAGAVERFGNEVVFKILLFSFLHANFLKTQGAMENLSRVIRLSFYPETECLKSIQTKDVVLLQKVFKTGLDLDPEFTTFTNQFCLRLLGIRTALPKLFAYDFLKSFETDPSYRICLDALTSLAIKAR
jgi:hypothetical protein